MDFIFQKVNVYREKYAVLAKFYPINDKNKVFYHIAMCGNVRILHSSCYYHRAHRE